MTELITQNVKDPSLREWIMPSFSTTTDSDKISAAIIMMGTMQKYFAYFLGITCGIPSVTLLGEKKDWEDILERIQFLGTFGPDHEELLIWNSVLTGVVSNFVRTFDAPDSPEVVKFWQRTVHQFADDYSGEKLITGWLLAFCFWDADGKPLVVENIGRITRNWTQSVQEHGSEYWLDGIRLGQLEWNDVPAGYAHVPIHIRGGDGEKYMAKAIAGSVGWRVLNSDSVFSGTRAIKKKSDKSQSNVLAFLTGDSESSSSSTFTSDSTLVERPSSKPGAFQRIVQKLLCFNSKNDDPIRTGDETSIQKAEATNPPHLHAQNPSNDYTPDHSNNWFEKSMRKNAPQISTLNELKKPWEYEKGGKNDTLQPVTGWWVVTTSKREYGKDPDCPDVTFDSDDEEYDPDVMGRHGEKLRREDDIWTRNDISLEYRDALPPVLREEIEKKLKEDEEEEKRQKLNKQRD
jgi:hypothetical protein